MTDASNALHDEDESVMIAARALGDMKNGRGDAVSSSTSDAGSPFVARMTTLPLVGSALRVYENSKASSRVVKYGAEMMESSVLTISRPVINRLPLDVNQLDEFACRQLDRFDRYRRPLQGKPESSSTQTPSEATQNPDISSAPDSYNEDRPRAKLKSKTLDGSPDDDVRDDRGLKLGRTWQDTGRGGVPSWVKAHSPFVGAAPQPPEDISPTEAEERQVAQRSRWHTVLSEAGGLGAALSEESMRRLQYCLHWLQFATAHIDTQILILRDFTASLRPLSPASQNGNVPISHAHMRTLTAVRRDVVRTIRQVVDVLSRYAGGALPEHAQGRVRGFILALPQRWARKAVGPREDDMEHKIETRDRERERDRDRLSVAAAGGATGVSSRRGRRGGHRERGAGGGGSTPPSRPTSPVARHPRGVHQEDGAQRERVSASTAIVAAERILTLATESLDMMRGVTGVVKDSLDRADAWVGRLRTVGIQRTGTQGSAEESSSASPRTSVPNTPRTSVNDTFAEEPEEYGTERRYGRRRAQSSSSQSVYDESEGLASPYSGASSIYSSYNGGSIPSTPGGTFAPALSITGGGGGYGGYHDNAASPGGIGLGLGFGSMSLSDSRYSTPTSIVRGLPEEEDGEGPVSAAVGSPKFKGRHRPVKIVGMDVESGGDEGVKMEVDE